MPEEEVVVGSDDHVGKGDQERESRHDSGGPRHRSFVTFGLGAAALAGVISMAGSATAPSGSGPAHAAVAADPHAMINQLIAGGVPGCIPCTPGGCET